MKTRYFQVMLLSLLLTACATVVSYDDVKEGPSSRVRLAVADGAKGTFMNGGPNVTVYKFEDDQCNGEKTIAMLRNGPLIGSRGKKIGIPLYDYHKNAAKEYYMPVNIPVTMMFYLFKTDGVTEFTCGVVTTTTFEENKDYELVIKRPKTQLAKDANMTCIVEVSEIVSTDDDYERKSIQVIDNYVDPASTECIRAFEKYRWF